MSIYLKNGYLNITKILGYNLPFNFIIGGRGTGKTYGALKHVIDNDINFMLMRRTQAQCDLINKAEFNPFKSLNSDLDIDIKTKAISKYNSKFYIEAEESEKIIGYSCALSTIANMRGFDASDVKLIIYDEFIPEQHERSIKNEGSALLNAYETINRNRELTGHDPVQMICLANAFNIANPIFIELNLIKICEKMMKSNNELFIDRDKGLLICMLNNSSISERKAKTALYKLTDNNYTDMALNNDFVYNDYSNVKSCSLKDYKIICTIDKIAIYKHKSNNGYYISEHCAGSPDRYTTTEESLTKYRKKYGMRLYRAYVNNKILFENMLVKSLFELYTV